MRAEQEVEHTGQGQSQGQASQTDSPKLPKPFKRALAWAMVTVLSTWIGWCTAVGPLYRANLGISEFSFKNFLIAACTFAVVISLCWLFSRGERGETDSQPCQWRQQISQPCHSLQSSGGGSAWLQACQGWLLRVTSRWQPLMLLLLLGWSWVWLTLLACYGADLGSQIREVSSWLALREGATVPYKQGFTIMDVYPTAHYLWPDRPTYITDQHNLPLTLLYGGIGVASRNMTGSTDAGIVLLAGLQLVFAAWCTAVSADRFFQPGRMRTLRAADLAHNPYSLLSAGPLARALTLLMLLACPLVVLSTISVTKSPLFAFACLWWLGILYEFQLSQRSGLPVARRTQVGLVISSVVMLSSAKYALYVLLAQCLLSLLSDRKRWLSYLVCLLLPVVLFEAMMTGLFASGTVIKSDPIEGKGIQLQQLARVAQRNPQGIPDQAQADLAPIMDLAAASRAYFPDDADKVKSSGGPKKLVVYRWRSVTAADMDHFNRAWLQVGRANPTIYADAFMAECYGYFDIADQAYVPMSYYVNNGYVQESNTWIRNWCHSWRDSVAGFAHGWAELPVLGWPARGNFWVLATLLLVAVECLRSRWQDLLYQFPLLLLVGVMIMSPANNFERHMLPLVFAFPFLVIACHLESRLENAEANIAVSS